VQQADSSSASDTSTAVVPTPIGGLQVRVTDAGVRSVRWLRAATAPDSPPDRRTEPVVAQLGAYFEGTRRDFDLEVDWGALAESPRAILQTLQRSVGYGQSITYGELARRSGTSAGARGVGAVMAANPIPVIVPCHRVLASTGLGGFSGGSLVDGRANLDAKRWLLTLEGVLPPALLWT
jgi:methylated-DNA-[protein]-cysteine S-methyltransferase